MVSQLKYFAQKENNKKCGHRSSIYKLVFEVLKKIFNLFHTVSLFFFLFSLLV